MNSRELSKKSKYGILVILAAVVLKPVPEEKTGTGFIPEKHVIEISAFDYHPQELEINLGDTVVWINKDIVPHTATASDESWNMDDIKANNFGKILVLEKAGKIRYYCRYHPSMVGTLLVSDF